MPGLWLVAPAYGRLNVTEHTFPQLRTLVDSGHVQGVVVVACDDNITLARSLGFVTVTQQPWPLGRKFNDGYQTALSEGAGWVMPACSDNWIHPDAVRNLPGPDEIYTRHRFSILDTATGRLATLNTEGDVNNPYGGGPPIIPADLLEPLNGRPVPDEADYGIDRATVQTVLDLWEDRASAMFDPRCDPLEIVGFKGEGSLTGYEQLRHLITSEHADGAATLAAKYPKEAVSAAVRPR